MSRWGMPKCCAPIAPPRYRSDESTDNHCIRQGRYRIAGKWFCYQHIHEWREHYRIVERIRAIRPSRLESNPSTTRRTP
jgi:hypothetical protein